MSFQRSKNFLASLSAVGIVLLIVSVAWGQQFSFLAVKKGRAKGAVKKDVKQLQTQLDQTNKSIDSLNKEISDEQKKSKEAGGAADDLKKDVDSAQSDVDKLHSDNQPIYDKCKAAKDKLEKIADDLVDAQPTSSPVQRAKVAFETARQKEQAELDRIMSLPDFKTAYQAAEDEGNRVKMADVRDQFIAADPQAVEASRVTKDSRDEYNEVRDRLLKADSTWSAQDEVYEAAKKDAEEAHKGETDARKKLYEAQHKYKAKLSDANRADAIVQRDDAKLKPLQQLQQQLIADLGKGKKKK